MLLHKIHCDSVNTEHFQLQFVNCWNLFP